VSGLVALVGGCEHRRGWELIGRDLVERTVAGRPRVALVPMASSLRKQPHEVERARVYWSSLGAAFGVADHRRSAQESADALAEADIVVISGGVPARLHAALAGSWIRDRIVELWRRGSTIVGSSAGAMELCEWRLAAPGPRPLARGLGLLGGCAAAPHFDRYGMHRWAGALVRMLGDILLVGVDERTALVGRAGRFEVVGEGAVTILRRAGRSSHAPGGEVALHHLRDAISWSLDQPPGGPTNGGPGG
jgi:cyanophycinase